MCRTIDVTIRWVRRLVLIMLPLAAILLSPALGDGDVELGPADVDLEEVAVIPDDTSNAPGVELADVNVTAPTAGTCNGDGDFSCPARDEINPVRENYDPADVDWNAVVADIEKVGLHEPRFCSMTIRSWFHDIGSHAPPDRDDLEFDGASDGSLFTDTDELKMPDSARHGFAQFSRHVIVQIAAAHGASHADALTVAAAQCTTILGGQVNIAEHCATEALPIQLGRLDYIKNEEIPDWKIRFLKTRNAPSSHARTPSLMRFFLKEINAKIEDAKWQLTQAESLALMGSHTILMTQACMTTGEGSNETAPDMGDRTCAGSGGVQRMFNWDNSFFQDITSGKCFNTNKPSGRAFTPQEHEDFTKCGFNSQEGFELGEQLECNAMKVATEETLEQNNGQKTLDNIQKFGAFNEGWFHGVWEADENAAPCCGFQCETCEVNSDQKFWCGGPIKDKNRFWPYTYMDCDLNQGFREGGKEYCGDGFTSTQCQEKWVDEGHQRSELITLIDNYADIMSTFRDDRIAWESTYATAFCKLSNFGTTYAPGKVDLTDVFSKANEGCLDASDMLSPKECETCNLEEFNAFEPGEPLVIPANLGISEELVPDASAPVSTDTDNVADVPGADEDNVEVAGEYEDGVDEDTGDGMDEAAGAPSPAPAPAGDEQEEDDPVAKMTEFMEEEQDTEVLPCDVPMGREEWRELKAAWQDVKRELKAKKDAEKAERIAAREAETQAKEDATKEDGTAAKLLKRSLMMLVNGATT